MATAPIITVGGHTTVDAIEPSALARHTARACVGCGFANNDNRRPIWPIHYTDSQMAGHFEMKEAASVGGLFHLIPGVRSHYREIKWNVGFRMIFPIIFVEQKTPTAKAP
jgi:hypothetical protein